MIESLNNWRLTRKMIVAFGLIAVMIVTMNVTFVISTNTISYAEQLHVTRGLPTTEALSRVLGALRDSRILMYSHLNALNAQDMATIEDHMAKNEADLDAGFSRLSEVAVALFAPDIQRLKEDTAKLREVNKRAVALSHAGREVDLESPFVRMTVHRDGSGTS